MRAEDLFEAVGGIDDKLIARSDRRVRSSQEKPSSGKAAKRSKKRKSRRSVGAEIYRFAVVAMSTAVVVFLFLMARDLLGIRNLSDIRNRIASTQESSITEPMQADEASAEQTEESAVMRAEEAAEKAEAERIAAAAARTAAMVQRTNGLGTLNGRIPVRGRKHRRNWKPGDMKALKQREQDSEEN